MKELTTLKRIWSIFLTLAMVLTMSLTALPAYAADGGTISVKYNPGVELTEATNFELYKVGTFGRVNGNVTIELEDGFDSSGVNLNIAVPPTEAEKAEGSDWHRAWLDAAKQLENWVKTPSEGKEIPDPVWSDSLAKSENYQTLQEDGSNKFFSRGIYLLVGDEQRVGHKYWSPVPVLIMVLNGESKFDIVNTSLKMSSRPVVYKHEVTKSWQDEGHEDARPESVKVDIFYGQIMMDTVTLNDDNDWTYTWYSTEADSRVYTCKDPDDEEAVVPDTVISEKLSSENNWTLSLPDQEASWRVDENQSAEEREKTKYYERSISYSGASEGDAGEDQPPADDRFESILITNTFRTAELIIKKDLKSYLDQEDANAVVAFEIIGRINGIDDPVYRNSVGMAFKGPGIQTIKLDNLPVKLDSLTVEEVYSTNYTLEGDSGPRTVRANVDQETLKITYTVEFVNKYNQTPPPTYSTGIVNIYGSDGTYTPKDDTSADYPQQAAQQPEPTVEPGD